MELDKLKITNIGEAERKLLLQAIGFKLNKKGEFDNFQCYYCGEKIDYRTTKCPQKNLNSLIGRRTIAVNCSLRKLKLQLTANTLCKISPKRRKDEITKQY